MFTTRLLRRILPLRQRTLSLVHRQSSSQYIVDSPLPPVDIPNITIHDRVFENIEKWPDHTAMECCMTGREYSYADVDELTKKTAAGFIKAGLKPGQVVSFILPNIPEFLIAFLAALRAGLVVSTVNPLYSPDEMAYQLSDSEAALAITFSMKAEEVKAAVAKIQGPKPIITVIHAPTDPTPEGCSSFMELVFGDHDVDVVDKIKSNPDDLALLLYSSGTTGLPKGVQLTHRNLVANISQLLSPQFTEIMETTDDHQDVTACVLPFFHSYGLVAGAVYLATGVKILTLPRFDPEMFLTALKDGKTTLTHVVPPLIQFLANNPAVTPKHLETVRCMINGAATMAMSDAKKLTEMRKGLVIKSGYGLTESSPVLAGTTEEFFDLTSVGVPVSNTQMKLVDTETGKDVERGQRGEICAKGPQVMMGYHKNPEATKQTIVDGWLRTGDIGYFDDKGQLFIVDRIKELIKVKGFQVAPLEIEEILREHPGVADCGVVGKPDERLGEVPVAFIVPSKTKPVTAKEIQDFVASKVADYKRIGEVVFIEAIPKNLTGKILRRKLKEELTKG